MSDLQNMKRALYTWLESKKTPKSCKEFRRYLLTKQYGRHQKMPTFRALDQDLDGNLLSIYSAMKTMEKDHTGTH